MIEFQPADAREVFNLAVNRVIVCWGNQAALLPLVDFLVSERQCGIHKSTTFPDPTSMESMQKNLRARPDGNVVILNTDEEALLPYHMKHGADLVLCGYADGTVHVYKNRGGHRSSAAIFRCTGTSSPTGRTFDPTGPRLQNMPMPPSADRAKDLGLAKLITDGFRYPTYSMGATVKQPDPCPMCEAGLPLVPSKVRFEEDHKPRLTILNMSVDKTLTLNGPDGREFIRVDANGDAFVRGEKVAAGQGDLYEMFRAWLLKTVASTPSIPVSRATNMHDVPLPKNWDAVVPLPTPGVVDRQGNSFTKECVDDLRKQVAEHGLPVRMFDPGPYTGPVWDAVAGNPCNEIDVDNSKNAILLDALVPSATVITTTGHDIVHRQEMASLANDVDSDPHISDSLRARLLAALKVC